MNAKQGMCDVKLNKLFFYISISNGKESRFYKFLYFYLFCGWNLDYVKFINPKNLKRREPWQKEKLLKI